MAFPLVCVVDTCVLFDLHVGGLLEKAFQRPFRLIAPDVIVAELEEPNGQTLLRHGLESRGFSDVEVALVEALRTVYAGSSTNDLFALVLAKRLSITFLTGDKALRQAAESEGVCVHGTLWVLDKLILHNAISKHTALKSLRQMLGQNRRLPKIECQKRLRKWTDDP